MAAGSFFRSRLVMISGSEKIETCSDEPLWKYIARSAAIFQWTFRVRIRCQRAPRDWRAGSLLRFQRWTSTRNDDSVNPRYSSR